jgi:hypothetical protein
MPWNTLDSILKRGIRTGSLANIKKITDELSLDISALANGELRAPGAREEIFDYEVSQVYSVLDEGYKKRLSAYAIKLREIQKEEDRLNMGELPADEE